MKRNTIYNCVVYSVKIEILSKLTSPFEVEMSLAAYTSPKEPFPSFFVNLYCPFIGLRKSIEGTPLQQLYDNSEILLNEILFEYAETIIIYAANLQTINFE